MFLNHKIQQKKIKDTKLVKETPQSWMCWSFFFCHFAHACTTRAAESHG